MNPTTPRYNIYTLIHKGLRSSMCQTLVDLGRLDDSDSDAVITQLEVTENLLHFCKEHLQHENEFIHTAIRELRPLPLQTADDHLEHELEIQSLFNHIAQIKYLPGHERAEALQNLYAEFSLFVAENFTHMRVEETYNAELLWAHFDDAEIHAIEQRIVGSLAPEDNLRGLLMMLPNIRHSERIQLLGGFRKAVPAHVFQMTLDLLKPLLNTKDWLKLNRDLNIDISGYTAA